MSRRIQGLMAFTVVFVLIFSQSQAQNISNVDISNLSSSQINQAKQALQSSGLSIEQAIEEAKKRGASETQIQQMVKRMQEGEKTGGEKSSASEPDSLLIRDSLGRMDQRQIIPEFKPQPKNQNFGSYLFNSQNLTFEPNINIQTPKNYEVNIGDEILINIWGNSIENYQLYVDQNGQINIPQIGPIYIAGKTFENASSTIKKRLSAIYADMAGSNPNTFAQVSMGRLRSIRVNIVGEVTMPGTYSLPATSSAFNALYLSGGPAEYGSFRQIEIHRDNKILEKVDLYDFLLKGDQSGDINLKNEDLIFIPIVPVRVKTTGEFKRENYFELKSDETIQDLIQYAGGFTDSAYREKIQIYRKVKDGIEIIDVPMNVEDENFQLLRDGDEIIASKISDRIDNLVTITGSVYRPGKYQWTDGMTIKSLIDKADGLMPQAERKLGQIIRVKPDSSLLIIPFNISNVIAGIDIIPLVPKDEVSIKSNLELRDPATISIDGLVREPGTFRFMDDMSVLDVVYLAGGFKEQADTNYVQVSRRLNYEEASVLTDKLVNVFTIPISRTIKEGAVGSEFKLEPYDQVFIRKAPGAKDPGTVQINGEVMYSGYYAIQTKNDKIFDLITWAGGLSPDAYLDAATLRKVGAGPVGIDLQEVLNNPKSRSNLRLDPGDVLTIPQMPETVNVFGEVQNPFATVYVPNKSVKYYIEKSGGWGERPHRRRIYVTYPDGSSAMTKSFIGWTYPRVKPGAQIHVPRKPERAGAGDAFSKVLATSSAVASLGITIASLANLLKN